MDTQSRAYSLLQKALQNVDQNVSGLRQQFECRSVSSTPDSEANLDFFINGPEMPQPQMEFATLQPVSFLEEIATEQGLDLHRENGDGFSEAEQGQLSPFAQITPDFDVPEEADTPLQDEQPLHFPDGSPGIVDPEDSLEDSDDSSDGTEDTDTANDPLPIKKAKLSKHQKIVRDRQKHKLLPACPATCRQKCSERLDIEARTQLWEQFWSNDSSLQSRRNFIQNSTTRADKATARPAAASSRRQKSITWSLAGQKVCKTMFLHTLGFTSAAVIRSLFEAHDRLGSDPAFGAPGDGRGGHKTKLWFSNEYKQSIRDFIETFRPACSHYRIAHAPNRRYLPSHLNCAEIFRQFCESQRQKQRHVCTYRSFFKVFQAMNIAFSQPQADKCSKCEEHEHAHEDRNHDCEGCGCEACLSFLPHRIAASEARLQMESDIANKAAGTLLLTCDMQKVLLLPQLQTKEWFFSQKLVLLNETFAEPGKNGHCYTVLWNEAEVGRKAEDVASSYVQFLTKAQRARDATAVIIFTDNCGSQNKNKILFTALVMAVNDPEVSAATLTIRYLEAGHTFMAADSVHGSITKAMKARDSIYDYSDFKDLISTSRHRLTVIEMDHNDKFEFPNAFKQNNDDLTFADIRVVQFRRDSASIFVKANTDNARTLLPLL